MWRLVFPVLRKSENWYPELRPYGSSDYQALSMNAKLKYNYIFKGCFKTDGSLSVGTSLYLGSLSPQLPFGSIFKLSGYLENVSGYWNICSFCQFSYGFRSTKGSFFLASSDNWALSPSWVFPIQDAFELTRERCYNHKWLEIWVNYKPAFFMIWWGLGFLKSCCGCWSLQTIPEWHGGKSRSFCSCCPHCRICASLWLGGDESVTGIFMIEVLLTGL